MSDALHDTVVDALRTVHDPEIPVNVYDLGLIYTLEVRDDASVRVTMTLTAPNCPVADQIVEDVRKAVASAEGVSGVEIGLVFDPPWTTEKMSEVGRLELQAMGIDPDRAKSSLASRPTGITIGRRPGTDRPSI